MADMAEVRKKMEEELDGINNSLENNKEGSITVTISSLIESDRKLPTGNIAQNLIKNSQRAVQTGQ